LGRVGEGADRFTTELDGERRERDSDLYVNTGRKLTPFHRSNIDPPPRATDR
jgi:hypothetical protein